MGGCSLGSYDLLSTSGSGDSTFLARRRNADDGRLFAIRFVDQDTAAWATSQIGGGWFPNLGPLVEVGRDGSLWFVVADVSGSTAVAASPRSDRLWRGLLAAAIIVGLLAAAGTALAIQ